jgi:hypothetical protein
MTPHKQREYKLDWCYLNQDSDTHIFQNEVKHLVDNIFSGDGRNHACVITCGSTAKTNLVMVCFFISDHMPTIKIIRTAYLYFFCLKQSSLMI